MPTRAAPLLTDAARSTLIERFGPLLAIDPRPCIGDRNFDAVDWALTGTTSTGQLEQNIDQLANMTTALDPMRT